MYKPLPTITESPETLQIQLRAETHPKKRSRLQALYLLASGQASSRLILAKLLAVHRHTLQAWLQLYEEGGLSALLTIKKAPGQTALTVASHTPQTPRPARPSPGLRELWGNSAVFGTGPQCRSCL